MQEQKHKLLSVDRHYSVGQGVITKAFEGKIDLIKKIRWIPQMDNPYKKGNQAFLVELKENIPFDEKARICGKVFGKNTYEDNGGFSGHGIMKNKDAYVELSRDDKEILIISKQHGLDSLLEQLKKESINEQDKYRPLIMGYYLGGTDGPLQERVIVTTFPK